MIIEEKYKIGRPIFEKLWGLKDIDLKEKLIDICKEHEEVIEILNNKNVKCIRIIHNEVPHEICFNSYDTIEICCLGIYYRSKYRENKNIKRFDEYFKIEV